MAKEIRVYSSSEMAHREACELHDNESRKVCSGTLKKGGNCVNKSTGALPGMMPMCKIHQDQLKVLGWCQATMPCGFECDRPFEWKPYGFQLCPRHRENLMVCYFLKIPPEVRLRIYRFLLPDRPIPARYGNSSDLTTDGGRVYMAILRVNHQIHDEAAGLLYGTSVFTVELFGDRWTICNSSNIFHQPNSSSLGNHALQDYQMQLMLLEQQNKKRLMMARQEQANMDGESSSHRTLRFRGLQLPSPSPISYPYGPIQPVWCPPLSDKYFDMIRFFHVEVVFPFSNAKSTNNSAQASSSTDAANDKALELRLYDYCDHLHKLVGRLRHVPNTIAHIEVIFMFTKVSISKEKAFNIVKLLLKPFQRLSNYTKLKIRPITMKDFQGLETELLLPDSVFSAATSEALAKFSKRPTGDLSWSQPSFGFPQVFEAYWQLEKLLDNIKKNYHYAEPQFDQFTDLLHAARIARETDDLVRFREIWDQVVNIWFDHLKNQRDFQSNVARSINAMYDVIVNGSEASGSGGSTIS